MSKNELWNRYVERLCRVPSVGLALDTSRVGLDDAFVASMEAPISEAFDAMEALEKGSIANADEGRMVGHYWLRAPELAPAPGITAEIEGALSQVRAFSSSVRAGVVVPERGGKFECVLVVGIGGSALGPQFVSDALRSGADVLEIHFFDNTDPDGMERVLSQLGDRLERTLTVIISKSGGTKETRNGMLTAQRAYREAGLDFARHAVAVTGASSALDRIATSEGWLARFPMWDWVGGRTSELSAVGLLPAALQGFDIDALLAGARDMDVQTRRREVRSNPAALLALTWYRTGTGRGTKDMVILPYKDRLLLFSRYLQQLVMESLGKELDLDGKVVHQGIAVYGNKGSTDQHAYVQQLRDGVHNFFVTFIEVLKDQDGEPLEVEPDVTPGDYLHGFLLGTREALYQNGRESITITVPDVSERTVGALIALYERAVGLYASLIHVNAYHQPGVEAGKKAAEGVIALQRGLLRVLRDAPGEARTAAELAELVGEAGETETAYAVLVHLAANGRLRRVEGKDPSSDRFGLN